MFQVTTGVARLAVPKQGSTSKRIGRRNGVIAEGSRIAGARNASVTACHTTIEVHLEKIEH